MREFIIGFAMGGLFGIVSCIGAIIRWNIEEDREIKRMYRK